MSSANLHLPPSKKLYRNFTGQEKRMVQTGLERLVKEPPSFLEGRRLGLLCHQASILPRYLPAPLVLKERYPRNLRLLFAPQHGLFGEKQANMISSADFIERRTGLPVVSLYGPRLAPRPEHLAEIDVLLVDLQDVGCRVYTYIWTLLLCMEACAQNGVEVVVLDRPNPLGRKVEGPLLDESLRSFVGLEPLPMRHGLTIGELALYFKKVRRLDLPLRIIPLRGWKGEFFPETGLPWIPPSPNMPLFETALVYPGQVLLEGTNLSEGRGTTRPFEVCGAPWLDPQKVLKALPSLPGVIFQEVAFEPWFDKWAGRVCHGLRICVVERKQYQPVLTSLALLHTVVKTHEAFVFRYPPYEYEWHEWPFDIIVGKKGIRENLERLDVIEKLLQEGLKEFQETVEAFKLYRDV